MTEEDKITDVSPYINDIFGPNSCSMCGVGNVDGCEHLDSIEIYGGFEEREHLRMIPSVKMIDYKYDEDRYVDELKRYIDNTYNQHYSQGKYQATEFIIDAGHGPGFLIGNIFKYAQRYGRKGTPADHRKDLMKVIHYAMMMLHVHDKQQGEVNGD